MLGHDIRLAAEEAYGAGLCVLPVRADGSKAPAVRAWGRFKAARPTPAQMDDFAFDEQFGLGMVVGPVSGHRECWDIDDPVTWQVFEELALASGLGAIVMRIRRGYEDLTPRGGRRWIATYPPSVVWKDQTLARRRRSLTEVNTLIELPTFAVLAPSAGPVHPSGRPYRRLQGGWSTIASYTEGERTALIDLAKSLDEMPLRVSTVTPRQVDHGPGVRGRRPGDLFNARASWTEVLEPLGWVVVGRVNEVTHWIRPGKEWGTSATTNHGGRDLLHVFSSSTVFEPDRSYTKFGAYATAVHGGDYARAALALAQRGYEVEEP